MAIRILWDEEEAAILLEALVATLEGRISREDAISSVSQELRERAPQKGIEIDEIFRNINGITLQMSTMEYIFTDGKSGLKKGGKMTTFRNVVSMYKSNRRSFEKLLEGARQKMKKSYNVQDEFFAWLATKVSATQLSDFYRFYAEIESFCSSRKIINQKLFETVNLAQISDVLDTVNTNKAFRFMHRKSTQKMSAAIKYYYEFVKMHPELNNIDNMKIDEGKQESNGPKEVLYEDVAEMTDSIDKTIEKSDADDEEIVLEFSANNSLVHTEPTTISYFGEVCSVCGTWKYAYVKAVSWLQEDYPDVFENLLGKNIYGRGRIDIGHRKDIYMMTSPKKITDTIYLETNYSATDIVKKIRVLLDTCNVDYENLEIKYKNKNQEKESIQSGYSSENKEENVVMTTEQQMINPDTTGRMQFMSWMKERNIPVGYIIGYTGAIKKCTKLANEKKIYLGDLFEIENADAIHDIEKKMLEDAGVCSYEKSHGNMLQEGLEKLIEFKQSFSTKNIQKTKHDTGNNVHREIAVHTLTDSERQYAEILNKYFAEDGYQLGRAIFRGRFKRFFRAEFDRELSDSDEKMEAVLQRVGAVRDGRVFPKQDTEQSNLVEAIINDIVDTLNAGASAVYIEAVYDKYQQRLAENLQIYHIDALTNLLIDNAKGRYIQRYSYLVKGWNNADIEGDVLRVMQASHRPLNYEEIHRKLWFIPYDKMKHLLVIDKSIVNVAQETYFYAPNLPINADELKALITLIQTELEYRSYITDVELMELIQMKLPSVAVNTDAFTTYGLRNCLGYILRHQFSFNGPIISEIGKELSMSDVYAEYARQHEKLTLDDIKNLSKEMDTIIYWDSIRGEQIRISEKEFVRRDLIKFDIEAIDSVLDGLCTGDYMPIKDITLFLYFPSVGYQWNSYILESYLYNVSRKFKLLHASFVQSGVFGAMVKSESNIKEYSDLIIDVLSRSSALKNTKSALQYIVNSGYQQRLRLTGIEQMVAKAKLMKEKREKEEK